ncbi:MAG: hypothetical protein HC914_07960, partial [Chloroflexaceae bacterium]|nr:hypothetical protein [Chloroflexaceae bacterium]
PRTEYPDQSTERACRLIVEEHTTTQIDAMQIDNQRFFLQIGFGIDSLIMRDTPREEKRRFGRLAYVRTGIGWLFGHNPIRFTLVVDGKRYRPKATQISIVNGGAFGIPFLRWAPDIYPDDGQVDVCIVKARSLLDYFLTFWQIVLGRQRVGRRIQYFTARESVTIHADRPIPGQADGELIEELPVRVRIVPGALKVVVPPEGSSGQQKAPERASAKTVEPAEQPVEVSQV